MRNSNFFIHSFSNPSEYKMFIISMIGICLHITQLHAVKWRRCVLCTVKKETTHTRTCTRFISICTKYKKSNYLENSVEECRPQSVACLYHLRVDFLFGCCKENNLVSQAPLRMGNVNQTQDISVNLNSWEQ